MKSKTEPCVRTAFEQLAEFAAEIGRPPPTESDPSGAAACIRQMILLEQHEMVRNVAAAILAHELVVRKWAPTQGVELIGVALAQHEPSSRFLWDATVSLAYYQELDGTMADCRDAIERRCDFEFATCLLRGAVAALQTTSM